MESPPGARLAQMETRSNKVIPVRLVFRLVLRIHRFSLSANVKRCGSVRREQKFPYNFYNIYTPPSRVGVKSASIPSNHYEPSRYASILTFKYTHLHLHSFFQKPVGKMILTRYGSQQDTHMRDKISHHEKTSTSDIYLILICASIASSTTC